MDLLKDNLKTQVAMVSLLCYSTCNILFFQDGLLSKEEVINKYDLFVGSQVTDFGEALTRHDEF